MRYFCNVVGVTPFAGMPGVPRMDGAADVAVSPRAPRVRAMPRATQRVSRLPDHLLFGQEPRHGRGNFTFIHS